MNPFIWEYIGPESWTGSRTSAAMLPNCAYGDDCYVVCDPSPGGWSILAPLPKQYIDKLRAGKVKLHAQYKNPNYQKRFLHANRSEQTARYAAEELARSLMRKTV